jgi:hypothetical protein
LMHYCVRRQADFVNAAPAADETDINQLGDRVFLEVCIWRSYTVVLVPHGRAHADVIAGAERLLSNCVGRSVQSPRTFHQSLHHHNNPRASWRILALGWL